MASRRRSRHVVRLLAPVLATEQEQPLARWVISATSLPAWPASQDQPRMAAITGRSDKVVLAARREPRLIEAATHALAAPRLAAVASPSPGRTAGSGKA